jgi:hypothetical protein
VAHPFPYLGQQEEPAYRTDRRIHVRQDRKEQAKDDIGPSVAQADQQNQTREQMSLVPYFAPVNTNWYLKDLSLTPVLKDSGGQKRSELH